MTLVRDLHHRIWNAGDLAAIADLVAPAYTIHADPGDPWEGQTLDRDAYARRVRYSRDAFPDLVFTIHDEVAAAAGDRVAVRWTAAGTQTGPLRELPATGRRLTFAGQTIYAIDPASGQLTGHWQVVDRLGFIAQLRPA